MMAAILNSTMLDSDTAILNSDTLLSSLRFTQKHSHCQFWHSAILVFSLKLPHTCQDLVPTICTKKPWLIHSHLTWWWQPSCILPSWILTLPSWILIPCYILSDSLKSTLFPLWLWLKLIQSDPKSFILTQLDDCSHLEFCQFAFSHFSTTKTSLIHSDSTWWWQPYYTLPRLDSATICTKKLHLIFSDSIWW